MTDTARPEPFDSSLILSPSTPLILSLSKDERSLRMYLSKDERLAQDVPVEGRAVVLVVRRARHERVICVDDEIDDDLDDDEDDFFDTDDEDDGDEDQDDDEDDVETWQVGERRGGFPLKLALA